MTARPRSSPRAALLLVLLVLLATCDAGDAGGSARLAPDGVGAARDTEPAPAAVSPRAASDADADADADATAAAAPAAAAIARAPNAPAPVSAPASDAWFVDATRAWGVSFVHDAGVTDERHLPETMGAGAALIDVDADGDLDLYLVQSGPMPVGESTGERPGNALLLNAGDGRMSDVSDEVGAAADRGYGMGCAAGDVDGDGRVDLFVTNLGPDVLLLNRGGVTFTDATSAAGVGDPRWTAGATLFDADADGDLDLYVTAYVDVDLEDPIWCGRREPGWRSYCHPDHYPGLDDRFYVNRGDGRFDDRTAESGLGDNGGKGLGAIATDLDDDGLPDLYVANDSVENKLWLNRGGARFEDATLLSGTGVNGRGLTEAGMGLASGDLDGDGRLDLYVTNFDEESNTLYRNDGDGLFSDVTAVAGLEAATRPFVGFGTVAFDAEGDGDLDLAVCNGHIIDNIHLYYDGRAHAQPGQLFVNDGTARFENASTRAGALARTRVGRGLYAGDLDGDGDLDLVLTECDGPAALLRNDAPAHASVTIEGLARGRRVTLGLADGRELVRAAGPQPSYFGQSAEALHVGLDDTALARLEVREGDGLRAWVLDPPVRAGRLRRLDDGRLHRSDLDATIEGSLRPPEPER